MFDESIFDDSKSILNIETRRLTPEEAQQLYPDIPCPDKFTRALPPEITVMDLQDLYKAVINAKKMVEEKVPFSNPMYNKLMHTANEIATGLKSTYGEENMEDKRNVAQVSTRINISYIDELEKLAGLRKKGIITDEEFNAKKKQILGL